MSQYRVLLGFATAADHSLEETTGEVLTGLYGNPVYPLPPVLQVALQAALTLFTKANADQSQGGTAATAWKDEKREELIGLLRQLAGYVQEKCLNNLAALLTSGFEAVSTNRASTALTKAIITGLNNGNSGQLLVRVSPIANAKVYEVRYAIVPTGAAPGPWQTGGLFTNSRSMPLSNLTPGTMYVVQVRAIGGSTGYGDWSDPVSHMSL